MFSVSRETLSACEPYELRPWLVDDVSGTVNIFLINSHDFAATQNKH
jgi:hypothetical protein